jgi:hypothetical protein
MEPRAERKSDDVHAPVDMGSGTMLRSEPDKKYN